MPKYVPFGQIPIQNRKWPDNTITNAPIWTSVDLRDGNQSLAIPMGIEQKLKFFDILVNIGFKEIEIGFPSSSDTEFNFLRRLIDENRIPSDVTVQVLCQAREHLVIRTFEALKGVKKAIFHIYNSTSPSQRKYTFNMSKDEIKQIAIDGVKCVKKHLYIVEGSEIMLEYSPESFSNTEIDYAIEICEAVKTEWGATPDKKIILNLPTTVECSTPNIHADQIEYFCQKITGRDSVLISLHTHNDRGTGVASTELALMAGADRVEGTLFGNGERTGNLDIVTVALNMYTQGVDPKLDFSHINQLVEEYKELTKMDVHARHPYCGELVFTAFSGSHQDAIRKGMAARTNDPNQVWDVPYLPIDPRDLGREYEEIIRVNSQSGKGGAAWILEQNYSIFAPKAMQQELGRIITGEADKLQRELSASEIYEVFSKTWLDKKEPLCIVDLAQAYVDGKGESDEVLCRASINWKGETVAVSEKGNGPLDAFVLALQHSPIPKFTITDFHEHSIGQGSGTEAMAYVQITYENGTKSWGCAKNTNIGRAGINAVVSAVNQLV